jgi:hypothetical protein
MILLIMRPRAQSAWQQLRLSFYGARHDCAFALEQHLASPLNWYPLPNKLGKFQRGSTRQI